MPDIQEVYQPRLSNEDEWNPGYIHMPANASELGIPVHPREWRVDLGKLERWAIEIGMRPAKNYWQQKGER